MSTARWAVVAFATLSLTAVRADEPKAPEGFVPLFNGKDLSGWQATGKKEVWGAENGVLFCQGSGGGYLLSEKEFGDFELRFDFRWSKEGGNSGVALRTPAKGDPAYQGMEIQLIDDENWEKVHKFKLAPHQHTGSVYDVAPAKKQANKPVGEWNSVRIVCKGRNVTVELNGEKINEADLSQFKEKEKRHPGILRDKGHVGFQSYNFRVEFRNVFVKE